MKRVIYLLNKQVTQLEKKIKKLNTEKRRAWDTESGRTWLGLSGLGFETHKENTIT